MRERISSFARGNMKLLLVVGLVAVVTGATGAVAASKFVTSKKIKNNTIRLVDLSTEVRSALDANRTGTPGTPGSPGAAGADAEFEAGNWGLIARNTTGTGVAYHRSGPFTGPSIAPPFGDGSLGIQVTSSEKVAFGNEVDFGGDPVGGLNEVGFHVYATGEDVGYGANNLPNIQLEINPSVASVNYTSMVYNAQTADTVVNGWSVYLDTTDAATANRGWWFTNGAVATATGCSQASFCSLAQAKQALVDDNDGGPAASILSLGVGKGTDFQFQGAVDGLRVNDTVFDFEPLGVVETTP